MQQVMLLLAVERMDAVPIGVGLGGEQDGLVLDDLTVSFWRVLWGKWSFYRAR